MKKLNNKGFSLVELIIVIAILAILVGVLAPQLIKYIEKAKVANDTQIADTLHSAITYALMDPEVNSANDGSEVWIDRFTCTTDEYGGSGPQQVRMYFGCGYDTTDCKFLQTVTEIVGFNPFTTNAEDQGFKSTSGGPYSLRAMAVVNDSGSGFAVYVQFSDRTGNKQGETFTGSYNDLEDSKVIFVK